MSGGELVDVEPYRHLTTRTAVRRRPGRPVLVLGSTQPADVVDGASASSRGLTVVRRRSGGGAVLVGPDDPLWLDLWIPAADPLWRPDVVGATDWVGEWLAGALTVLGVPATALSVHRGPARSSAWSRLVCFSGLGPGEVTLGGRKVTGVAQWRCRQGALFHLACYRHLDLRPLLDVLALPPEGRAAAADELARGVTDLERATGPGIGLDEAAAALFGHLPDGAPWSVVDDGARPDG